MSPDAESTAWTVSRSGTTITVALRGEIDIANASELRTCLTGCVADGCADIVLDMQDLTFIDASGLSVLASVTQLAESRGGRLTLQNSPPIVNKVLAISGLAGLIHVTDPDSRWEQQQA
jgi:anti-anti-sigma factor